MFYCICGKSFDNRISCSRHKSTCEIYKYSNPKPKEVFEIEGKDHVVCLYCGYRAKNITRHLYMAIKPHLSFIEYKKLYPNSKLICLDVDLKRKETCKNIYGNENYRNRDSQSEGVRRAFKENPEILEKIKKTKLQKYGDSNFINIEKRKQTLLKKYGVDNPMKNKNIVDKMRETRKILYKDNPIERVPVIEETVLRNLYREGITTLSEIGLQLGYSEAVIGYWMKKYKIKIVRKVVSPLNKKYIPSFISIKSYLEECRKQNKVLSFSEYGILTEDKNKQRLKRLFNSGRSYHYLLDELKSIALKPELWDEFLLKIK